MLDQDAFLVYGIDIVLTEKAAKEAEEEHKRQLHAKHARR